MGMGPKMEEVNLDIKIKSLRSAWPSVFHSMRDSEVAEIIRRMERYGWKYADR